MSRSGPRVSARAVCAPTLGPLLVALLIMKTRQKVQLEFKPKLAPDLHQEDLRKGLSAAAITGPNLWLVSDRGQCVERLTEVEPGRFANHVSLPLRNYLQIPKPKAGDFDLEGLDVGGGYLWICGSHSLVRGKPKSLTNSKKAIQELGKVHRSPNRFFLGRIPIVETHDGPDYVLTQENGSLRAGILRSQNSRFSNELVEALAEDPMFAPYLHLTEKDNGLNIEGIAVSGEKIFLGLRGPVLQGWAIVIKIEVEEDSAGFFRLKKRGSRKFTKHFLSCRGLGFRDLKFEGPDLLLIAGPTMTANGPIQLFRWKNAAKVTADSIHHEDSLQCLGPLPTDGQVIEHDRAEGLALIGRQGRKCEYLLVHDRPAAWRTRGKRHYQADVLEIGPAGALRHL